MIKIQKMPRSDSEQSLTLIGYSSVFPKKKLQPGDLYLSQDLPHHDQPTPYSAPSFIVQRVGVSSNSAVARRCVLMQGK